ncbi:MAG TPA: heme exporter protein CcmD [Pseudorhizobium sp.]|jgi:heme exporter protein D|nr:heme exporter protein CcmD [Pseudorhizobium sp.]
MSHGFYIALSYGVSALIVAIVAGWVWWDGKARQKELAELERAGVRRRSSAPAGEAQ